MPGRLAIDFGTSNTVAALWNEGRGQGETLHIPGYGKEFILGEDSISVVPSVIHYADRNTRWIGQQVIDMGLYGSRRTFRWMKQYIGHRSPIKIKIDDEDITPFRAGKEFLSSIITFALQEAGRDGEIAFTAPVESFEHYENWLTGVAEAAGITRYRLLDEPSAAALGYGVHIQPGSVYLVFDFGGGTLHASVILMENVDSALSGKRCRVLGKSGKTVGGSKIDQWLFQDFLKRHRLQDSTEEIRTVSMQVLAQCEKLKEQLSSAESGSIEPIHIAPSRSLEYTLSRSEFEDILDKHNLFTDIGYTIRSALNDARERGYSEDQIQSVLMVGGSSQIPAVQRTLRQIFGKEKVQVNRPLDAVARGAAAFIAGVDFYDHIQHDYAIRYIDPERGSYEYRTIVNRGTNYPSSKAVARLAVKASYEGQQKLGVAIFEIGERRKHSSEAIELVFDPTGAARLVQATPQEIEDRSLFWMNEQSPTFLVAEPPARKGVPRFDVEFFIDENKRLVITARDLETGKLILNQAPVIRLI